jgi:N-acetylmuramoyl-L-alanine amidase
VRTPSGILALWYGSADNGGLVVSTPCNRRTTVPSGQAVRGVDVLLDPGHGGLDPGAKAANGMAEAELNLDVARRVRDLLVAAGRTVELTRDDDYFRTIQDRALLATAIGPKAFVSIHHNSGIDAPTSAGIGSEIYHQVADADARRLGGLVYQALDESLGRFDMTWTRSAHFGVRYRANNEGTDFYGVLRRSAGVPAILVEGAYLSNAREAQLLRTDEFRAAEAEAIADGILRWLTTEDEGSGYQNGFVEAGSGGDTDLSACRDPSLVTPRN